MRQELALIAALVSIATSMLSHTVYQTSTKSPLKPSKAVCKAILSPLIMIAFLLFFKFKFVVLDNMVSAVSFGVLVGACSVAAVSNTMAMMPSIVKLLIAKWLGIDAKNIQTPDETSRTVEAPKSVPPKEGDKDLGAT